jgi:Protein of unknown function (DUF3309)
MLIILIVLLVLAFGGGFWGHSQNYGYASWSPLGIILVVLVLFYLFGGGRLGRL